MVHLNILVFVTVTLRRVNVIREVNKTVIREIKMPREVRIVFYGDDDIALPLFPRNAWPPDAQASAPCITPKRRPAAFREPVDEGILKAIIRLARGILDMLREKKRIVIVDLNDCFIFGHIEASSLTDTYFLGLVQCVEGYLYEEKGFYVGYPTYNNLKAMNCVGIATFPAHSGDAIVTAIKNIIQVLTKTLSSSVDLIVVKTSEVPDLPSCVRQINPMELQRRGRLDDLARYLLEEVTYDVM